MEELDSLVWEQTKPITQQARGQEMHTGATQLVEIPRSLPTGWRTTPLGLPAPSLATCAPTSALLPTCQSFTIHTSLSQTAGWLRRMNKFDQVLVPWASPISALYLATCGYACYPSSLSPVTRRSVDLRTGSQGARAANPPTRRPTTNSLTSPPPTNQGGLPASPNPPTPVLDSCQVNLQRGVLVEEWQGCQKDKPGRCLDLISIHKTVNRL